MIHGIESYQLLEEVDRQAAKNERNIKCLLQLHIAQEQTKFGLSYEELQHIITDIPKLQLINQLNSTTVCGLMGMATFTDDEQLIRKEFSYLKTCFDECRQKLVRSSEFDTLSMGMSADYRIAIEEGSNMIRVGSLLFGAREPK
jgi:pyridoxal phosphate enzyme (YggS family)